MSRELVKSGNDLVAIAAIDAGCKFFGGYPISPSSEVTHNMSNLLPKNGGKFIQMEDELSGISVAIGASMSGTKAMTASSGPGISLKAEQIGYGYMIEAPLVIVNVMRGGPSTGLPTRPQQSDLMQAKHPSHGDMKNIVLVPGNLEECYSETVRAFNLAEKYMQPVFLLLDETLGHMHGNVTIPDASETAKIVVNRREFTGDPKDYKPFERKMDEPAILNPFFKGYNYHLSGLVHDNIGFPSENEKISIDLLDRLFGKVESHLDDICEVEKYQLDDANILLIAFGSTSLAVKDAINKLRKDGVKIGLYRPKTVWPTKEDELLSVASKFDKIMVVEQNKEGQYSNEVERVIKKPFVKLLKYSGRAISPSEIISKVKEL